MLVLNHCSRHCEEFLTRRIFRPPGMAHTGFAAQVSDITHLAFARDGSGQVTGFTVTTTSGIARPRFDRAP